MDPNQIEPNAIINEDSSQMQFDKNDLDQEKYIIGLRNESEVLKPKNSNTSKTNSEIFDEFLLNSSMDENILKIKDQYRTPKDSELLKG